MVHPPSVCSIEVQLSRVLWLTRGHRWSYAFLQKPLLSAGDTWESLQGRAFYNITPTATPYSLAGRVFVSHKHTCSFIATTFLDPVRRDEHGRPVTHHLVWFLPDGAQPRLVAPVDWGPQLVAAMGPAYDAVFDLDHADDGTETDLEPIEAVRLAFADALTRVSPVVRVEGEAVMLFALKPFSARGNFLSVGPQRAPRTLARALLVWAATFVALLLFGLALRRCS